MGRVFVRQRQWKKKKDWHCGSKTPQQRIMETAAAPGEALEEHGPESSSFCSSARQEHLQVPGGGKFFAILALGTSHD